MRKRKTARGSYRTVPKINDLPPSLRARPVFISSKCCSRGAIPSSPFSIQALHNTPFVASWQTCTIESLHGNYPAQSNGRASPSTKVRAADSILDHSAKAIELEDIEARVAKLEKAARS